MRYKPQCHLEGVECLKEHMCDAHYHAPLPWFLHLQVRGVYLKHNVDNDHNANIHVKCLAVDEAGDESLAGRLLEAIQPHPQAAQLVH